MVLQKMEHLAETYVQLYDHSKDNRRVNINAGGKRFTTSYATLSKVPGSKLAELVAVENPNHYYFLDINGKAFSYILDYLHFGKESLPTEPYMLNLLRLHAQLLKIQPLIEDLSEKEEEHSETNSSEDDQEPAPNKSKPRRRRKSKKDKQEFEGTLKKLKNILEDFIIELQEINNGKEIEQQKKDEGMQKMLKKLDDGIQRLVSNSGSIERVLWNLEKRQTNQNGSSRAGIVMVEVWYNKVGQSRFYQIDIISEPNLTPLQDVPGPARQTEIKGIIQWTYKNGNYRSWFTCVIAQQLIAQGYKLITVTESCDGIDAPALLQYIFVRT